MITVRILALACAATLSVAACATEPLAPRVAVMPGPYKPFAAFQRDQADCETYASLQTAGGARQANDQAVASGVIGATLGALVGAASGGRHATGLGAAAGATIGVSAGARSSRDAQYGLQQRYDIVYAQCMYGRGDQVPGYAGNDIPPPPSP